MTNIESFKETIANGYTFKGDAITLGGAVYEGQPIENALVKLPLKTLNRHGLIAGTTGTGKTKTLQVIAENLSKKGVPVLLMDLKGDLSGIAASGEVKPFILERLGKIGLDFQPADGFVYALLRQCLFQAQRAVLAAFAVDVGFGVALIGLPVAFGKFV